MTASTDASASLSVAIMAGGKSTRMGTNKAFIPFRDRPMIEHVIERVTDLGDELYIITNDHDPYRYLGLPSFGDIYLGHGPLGGLHSALYHASWDRLLVVACDMPWLNRDLLKYLITFGGSADGIVPRWGRFPEPLHALYGKTCLAPIEACLDAGDLKIVSFYSKVKIRFLEREEIGRFDPLGRSFANVNTPEDLVDAETR